MHKVRTGIILGLLFGTLGATLASGASIFNFDTDAVGKGTTFTDINNGIAATFSTSSASGFLIDSTGYPSNFQALAGNVLADPGTLGLPNLALTITFSPEIASISLNFAVNADSPTPFTLNAFMNNVLVGSTTVTGSIPINYSPPEGAISFSAAPFNSVILSTPAPYFAIDNVAVSATNTVVPEPGTMPLLTAVLSLAWAVRAICPSIWNKQKQT